MGRIPEGFELTLYTNCNYVNSHEVEEALIRAGISDSNSLSWSSSGNWKVIQIK